MKPTGTRMQPPPAVTPSDIGACSDVEAAGARRYRVTPLNAALLVLAIAAVPALLAAVAESALSGNAAATPASDPQMAVRSVAVAEPGSSSSFSQTIELVVDVALAAAWGSDIGSIGNSVPEEGAASGPMSFDVADNGDIYVLDQVNERVQIFGEGRPRGVIALPGSDIEDIALNPAGMALLRRFRRPAVLFFDRSGDKKQEVPLSEAIPAGRVTSLLWDRNAFHVEVDHDSLIPVANLEFQPTLLPVKRRGRPSADGEGAWLATLFDDTVVLSYMSNTAAAKSIEIGISFTRRLHAVLGFETNSSLFALHVLAEREASNGEPRFEEVVVIVDAVSHGWGATALAGDVGPEDMFRSLRLAGENAYVLQNLQYGPVIWRISR